MRKRTWSGSGGIVEKVGVQFATGQIRKVPKPPHPYGSPAMDLKKEEAEERAKAEAEAQDEK